MNDRLAPQQRQHAVRQSVGLGEHCRTSLLQNLSSRQVGRLSRKICVLDTAAGCCKIL